jgi:hypothetical protein
LVSIKLLNTKLFTKIKENTFKIEEEEGTLEQVSMKKILKDFSENKDFVF